MNETYAEGVPGIVLEVSEVPSGSTLTADHAIGVIALNVEDIADFSEDGGQLSIGGTTTILSYTTVDPDLNSILLSAPTTVLYEDTTPVLVYPSSTVKIALVQTDEDEDGFKARIPHSLSNLFATGIREPEEQENVVVRLDGATWVMSDAAGVDEVITRSLIRTAEDGQRWEIGSTTQWYGDYRSIKAFSGRTDETSPAEIYSRGTGIGIKSTTFTNTPPAEFGVANREFESGPLLYKGMVTANAGSIGLYAEDGPAEDGTKFGAALNLSAQPDSVTYQGGSTIGIRSNGLDDKAGVDVFSNGKIKINSYTIGGSGNDASIDIFMGGDPELAGTPNSRVFLDDDEVFLKVGSAQARLTSTGMDVTGGDVKIEGTSISRGYRSRAERTTNSAAAGTTAATAAVALTASTPVVAGRRYKCTWQGHVSSTSASATAPDRAYVVLEVDGADIYYQHVPIFIANMAHPSSYSYDFVAAATGTIDVKIKVWDTQSAAGSIVILATASLKAALIVEDIGV